MNIKDLVVTGIVKFLKKANIDKLVVEQINGVTKNELDTLQGVSSNIQNQINSVTNSLETAETEQTKWKTRTASAINNIPKKNAAGLTKDSGLVQFEAELKKTEDAIEGATAGAAHVLSPKKYVGSNGYLTDGTMVDYSNKATQWTGYENIIVQKHPQDPGNQVLITIPNTGPRYNIGFYNEGSTILANMFLPTNKIAYNVRVGRFSGDNNKFGADDTNSVVGTFTGDANATPLDILSGKSAYVKGEKISGSIVAKEREPETDSLAYWYHEGGVPYLCMYPNDEPDERYYRIQRGIKTPASNLGDAEVNHVISGHTFTSASGLKISGNLPDNTGVPKAIQWCRDYNGRFEVAVDWGYYDCSWDQNSYEYLEYSQVASAIGLTAGKIVKGNSILGITGTGATGVDTSDADATAANILKNKTVYVKGSKVTGTMAELNDYYKPSSETIGMTTRTSYVDASGTLIHVPSTKYLYVRMGATGYVTGSSNNILIPASKLGYATAADVLSGKTFTSINGVSITGTKTGPILQITVNTVNVSSTTPEFTNGYDLYSLRRYVSNITINSSYTGIIYFVLVGTWVRAHTNPVFPYSIHFDYYLAFRDGKVVDDYDDELVDTTIKLETTGMMRILSTFHFDRLVTGDIMSTEIIKLKIFRVDVK